MRKQHLTPEQQTRAAKLERSARDSLMSRFRPTSKHKARQEHNTELRKKAVECGQDPGKLKYEASPYIHWDGTLKQYMTDIKNFINWLVVAHSDVTTLRHKDRLKHAREYIQLHIDENRSASTISTYRSALAKLFKVSADKIHDATPVRATKDFTRSRSYCETRYSADLKKYGFYAELPRLTGVRKETLGTLKKELFIEVEGRIALKLGGKKVVGKTKGGRPAVAIILDKNQARIREILAQFEPGELMCPNPPVHLDVHGIRALYAADLYTAFARDVADISKYARVPLKSEKKDSSRPHQKRTSAPGVHRRKSDGKKFDRKALLTVSRSLGHNREDVAVTNYLR